MPATQNGPTPPSEIRIHVVDVASAADRIVYTTPQILTVVAWQPEGIYLTRQCWEGCGNVGGLWLINPSTGTLRPVLSPDNDHTAWRWIANGVAWGDGPRGNGNVYRLDLGSGAVTSWFTPPKSIQVVGLDQHGFPLVETQDPQSANTELWRTMSGTAGIRLFPTADSPSAAVFFDFVLADGDRTWIGGTGGLFELTSSGDLVPITTTLTPQALGLGVAGPCVAV